MKCVGISDYLYVVGDSYRLDGMFINLGDIIILRPTVFISIECRATSIDATGTTLEILDIIGEDEFANMMIDAEEVNDVEVASDEEPEEIIIFKSLTKKKLMDDLTERGIKFDASKTKKQILEELGELSNVKIV